MWFQLMMSLKERRSDPVAPNYVCRRSLIREISKLIHYLAANDYNCPMSELDLNSTETGELLRRWREIRRISQANLAQIAGISARHLSFVETGRSRPGRGVLLRLGRALALSYRQQNRLFKAAGYLPYFPEPPLEAPVMMPIWEVISQMLNQHEPFPALVVGPTYDVLWSNHGFQKMAIFLAGKYVLDRYPNICRLVFATDGARPYFPGWENLQGQILTRLRHEAETGQHAGLLSLYEELAGEFAPNENHGAFSDTNIAVAPFTVSKDGLLLNFISTFSVFNTAVSVTVQEMRIISLFPADEATRETYLARFAASKKA